MLLGVSAAHGYLHVKLHGKKYMAHRLAWLLHTGSRPSQQLDHINGVRDDNRIDNLRECTPAENQQNLTKYKNNSSGVQGVCWHKRDEKWMARINVDGKCINLGYFNTVEEATAARAAAKQKYHKFNPVDRETQT